MVIDTQGALAAFVPVLRAAQWVALDTEADSLHSYPEKLCLIQISTEAGDVLVDPLAGLDLRPLLEALNSHELILHGGDYDLRLLRKHHNFVPSSVFDTMLAARLLGERQFGLQSLEARYLGVKLEKGSQKANWARRPLTARMEQYARNDTRYLKPLADTLRRQLQQKGRLQWHQEACARLIDESTRLSPVDLDSVWRVKGSHSLSRPALAVLRELWHWREREARAADRPPFFILPHETLVDIAAAAAAHRPVEPLLPSHLSPRRRAGLLRAVRAALRLSADQHPQPRVQLGHRPSEQERERFRQLQRRRDAQARRLGIDPALIASRATLAELAQDWDRHAPELMRWQRSLLETS
ncbi:MAG: HRDC domain-containing protein [Verrucomicrobiales bacterium]|nr:HRDC domain-containing protein [Verrucomicrobiales bacterium]